MAELRATYESIGAVFEAALSQEQDVSRQIDTALRAGVQGAVVRGARRAPMVPHRTGRGEKSAREIVAKFRLVGNDPASLLDLDRELGSRSAAR